LQEQAKEIERLMVKMAVKEELLDDLSGRLTQKENEFDEVVNRSNHQITAVREENQQLKDQLERVSTELDAAE
jgi:predicted  nucleic acid-binding Zn-ribbon protein